jgi:hemerythrin
MLQWNPKLALGDAEIDGQHRELFRRFGALVQALRSGHRNEIGLLFAFLGEYVVLHFEAEERVMRDSAFPGATVHAAAHARFVREYDDLKRLYEANGPTHGIAVKTETWIEDWLRSHIAGLDQSLARHLLRRGEVPAVPPSAESGSTQPANRFPVR